MSFGAPSGIDCLMLIFVSFPDRITKVHETESVSRVRAKRFDGMWR